MVFIDVTILSNQVIDFSVSSDLRALIQIEDTSSLMLRILDLSDYIETSSYLSTQIISQRSKS